MNRSGNFKLIFEHVDDRLEPYWRWRVISPWNYTSAGRTDTLRGAIREAKRARRHLANVQHLVVDTGNPPHDEGIDP